MEYGDSSSSFVRSLPGVLEETAISRVIQRQHDSRSQRQASAQAQSPRLTDGSIRNTILDQELALVAEAKRVSELETSGILPLHLTES